jgi:hypothetical protein
MFIYIQILSSLLKQLQIKYLWMNECDIGHLSTSTNYPKKSNNYSVIDVTWRNMDKHIDIYFSLYIMFRW